MTESMVGSPAEVLDFWFDQEARDSVVADRQAKLWWSKTPALDADIKARFASTLLAANTGALAHWTDKPTGRLALILLADQMSRNMFRDQPEAFAFDSLARAWCKTGLSQRVDLQLRPIQRVFYYMPLEHSESIEDQALSVRMFDELASSVSLESKQAFDWYLDFAKRHQAIIERFGRFPHRNRILQRDSTSEELQFLQQPGSSF
jgi:uncharacterized protein (DUF924 family)